MSASEATVKESSRIEQDKAQTTPGQSTPTIPARRH
jgi:hypothetical protein